MRLKCCGMIRCEHVALEHGPKALDALDYHKPLSAQLKRMDPDAPIVVPFAAVVATIDALPPASAIDAMAEAFVRYSKGEVSVPPIQTLGQPPLAHFVGHKDAQACIKSAYINGYIDHGLDSFIQQLEDKVRHLEKVKGLLKEVGYCTAAVGCCTAITGTRVHVLNAIFECMHINDLSGA